MQPATGFLSSNQPVLQFGLGASEKIDHITVKWQRGHVQRFENLQAGRTYLIKEPSTAPPKWTRPARGPTLYAPVNSPSLRKIAHRETPYDDFARQPLLPYKHSQLGPGMAWHDVDGDGDNDVITSLAAHGYGLAWIEQTAPGKWKQNTIINSKPEESPFGVKFSQLHAIDLADIDGDGLLDIITGKRFWAHGPKGDQEPNAPAVLYWFELTRKGGKAEYIPHQIDDNSGVGTQVAAGDVNGDGLLDIVVGNKKGAFVHLHSVKKVSKKQWQAAQPKRIH